MSDKLSDVTGQAPAGSEAKSGLMQRIARLRLLSGIFALDVPRYVRGLLLRGNYLSICNRQERLEAAPDGAGYQCMWKWTSDLHAPTYLPFLGGALLKRALLEHPIRRAGQPQQTIGPQVSFVIGHRGIDRLPHLLTTLESIAGQAGAAVECIVVEQDTQALLAGRLPAWVRHVHTPPPDPKLRYCRSWAFNVGARYATSDVIVLHDNDILVPTDYAAHILRLVSRGFEVVNLKRFIFYLAQEHSRSVMHGHAELTTMAPLSIMQNNQGGGSIAITRTAYDAIGGFDEAFVGWGGEDVEFWERACSRRVWAYAFLPVVHLWHGAQPDKADLQGESLTLYYSLARTPVEQRIANLLSSASGALSGPARKSCAPLA